MADRAYIAAAAILAAVASTTMTHAAEIKLIASNAVKEACHDLLPAFERASGHKVAAVYGGTPDITKRIDGGEVVDLVVLSAGSIDGLIKRGRLAEGSRVDFVRSAIGVAIRPGAPKPDISSGDAVKASLIKASSIVISSGPSSVYLLGLFERMGIADALKPKIKQLGPGASVGEALARGEGDLGFTQVSEFVTIKGIDYLGPLPSDIQNVTVFSLGRHASAPSAEAARALVKFLTSPDAAPVIRHSGLEPG